MRIYLLPVFIASLSALTADAQNPGGVGSALTLWVKGSAGVTQSAGQVSAWANQAPVSMTTQPSTAASAAILLTSNSINFNPALKYTGTQLLTGTYAATPAQPPLIFAVARGGSGGATQFVANVYSNSPAGAPGMLYDATTGRYWVDGAGTECSNSAVTTNSAVLARVFYNSTGSTGSSYTALNGITNTACVVGPLNAAGGSVQLGGRTWDVGGRIFVGDLAEVVYFNSNTLTALQIRQVESYLALKYGLTQGNGSNLISYVASDGTTTFWPGNASYQNDVFGIGTDNGSGLTQTQSNSMNSGSGNGTGQSGKGNLVLATGTALTNKKFLLIGNDAGALTEQTTNVPVAAAGSKRLTRTWLVQNTGSVGAVNLSFDLTGLTLSGGTTASNYRLMVNQTASSDFTTGTQTYLVPASITGNLINFTGISLANNNVFTLITQASAALPATWVSFSGKRSGPGIELSWTTTNESNIASYEIETSTDGLHFEKAGTVLPLNGAGLNQYSFYIPSAASSAEFVRVRRTDLDNRTSISPTLMIDGTEIDSLTLLGNPVSGNNLTLAISAERSQPFSFRVINLQGQLLRQVVGQINPGRSSRIIDVHDLPPGLYLLQAQTGQRNTVIKFLKR